MRSELGPQAWGAEETAVRQEGRPCTGVSGAQSAEAACFAGFVSSALGKRPVREPLLFRLLVCLVTLSTPALRVTHGCGR